MVSVNPKILKWARESVGMTLEEAAKSIQLKNAYGQTGAERLFELEEGKAEPSRNLLLKMSNKYRRSLLIFYLEEPPHKGDRGQDFRTLTGNRPLNEDKLLDVLIRRVRTTQNMVKELLEDEETEPLSFVGSSNISMKVEDISYDILKTTDFKLSDFRKQKDYNNAFKYLRGCLQSKGIFVLLIGDLGSHHTDISVETFRGFALSDPIAPFVVINDNDVSWSFTAFHEVAHIWLGKSGVSGKENNIKIEQFCNSVAGELLLPDNDLDLLNQLHSTNTTELLNNLSTFSKEVKLSRAMVAYKLFKSDIINETTWNELNDKIEKDRLEEKNKRQDNNKKTLIDYKVIKRRSLGEYLLDLVKRNINEGILSPTKAGSILGVKPRSVDSLLHEIPYRGIR